MIDLLRYVGKSTTTKDLEFINRHRSALKTIRTNRFQDGEVRWVYRCYSGINFLLSKRTKGGVTAISPEVGEADLLSIPEIPAVIKAKLIYLADSTLENGDQLVGTIHDEGGIFSLYANANSYKKRLCNLDEEAASKLKITIYGTRSILDNKEFTMGNFLARCKYPDVYTVKPLRFDNSEAFIAFLKTKRENEIFRYNWFIGDKENVFNSEIKTTCVVKGKLGL